MEKTHKSEECFRHTEIGQLQTISISVSQNLKVLIFFARVRSCNAKAAGLSHNVSMDPPDKMAVSSTGNTIFLQFYFEWKVRVKKKKKIFFQ